MAYILHIDTSGETGIAMLAKDGSPISSRYSENSREHAGSINRMVEEVLNEAGVSLATIDAVAVCNGPGSYTGLRIGLATAKGYCYSLGKVLLLHNRLSLMIEEAKSTPASTYLAIIPARNGEYYAAARKGEENLFTKHVLTEELLAFLNEGARPLVVIGTLGTDLEEDVASKAASILQHEKLDIRNWATVTFQAYKERQFADIAYAEPEYLKAAFVTSKKPRQY